MKNFLFLLLLPMVVFAQEANDACKLLSGLPQCKHVECALQKDTHCTIIHIRQIHSKPSLSILPRADVKADDLLMLHKEIVVIATNLQKHFGVNHYYLEGLTTNGGPSAIRRKTARERYVADLESFSLTPNEAEKFAIDLHLIEVRFKSGDYGELPAILGGLEARASESITLRRKLNKQIIAAATLDKEKGTTNRLRQVLSSDVVYEDRENFVLHSISKDYKDGIVTNKYALLVFGGGHDFSDTVKRWNQTNNFKFSLIAVTPRTYWK